MQTYSSNIKKVLSIDWDYFVNASATDRLMYFPDGNSESISGALSDIIWSTRYNFKGKKDIRDFKVKSAYSTLRKFLKYINPHETKVLIAESHGRIYPFLKNSMDSDNDLFDITNIDFHHDIYPYNGVLGDGLTCGNWLRKLMEEKIVSNVTWVRQEDSDIEDVEDIEVVKGFTINSTTDFNIITKNKYDLIFLCKSRIWSPPHLDTRFISLSHRLIDSVPGTQILRVEDRENWVLVDRMKKVKEMLSSPKMRSLYADDELFKSFKKVP